MNLKYGCFAGRKISQRKINWQLLLVVKLEAHRPQLTTKWNMLVNINASILYQQKLCCCWIWNKNIFKMQVRNAGIKFFKLRAGLKVRYYLCAIWNLAKFLLQIQFTVLIKAAIDFIFLKIVFKKQGKMKKTESQKRIHSERSTIKPSRQ